MEAFHEFRHCDQAFWSLVKYVSETLGYTRRGRTKTDSRVRSYSHEEIYALFEDKGICIDGYTTDMLVQYCTMRADVLNNFVRVNLMNAQSAEAVFEELYQTYQQNGFCCKLPLNKQSGVMRRVNYFTAIVNIITEKTIREEGYCESGLGFNDDPRGLVYILNDNGKLLGATSRRFDGALPGIINPMMVWEIKEYYYATTFGSRVADGVYETELDGFELKEIYERTGLKIDHVFMIDAYKTWWEDGKSYLCRIIDALNAGLVDEVIFGREVLTRWPDVIKSVVSSRL